MTDDDLHEAIAQLRADGLAQTEARIAPFAAALAALVPQILSKQFEERAHNAIALVRRSSPRLNSPDLVDQIAEDVDRNGIDVQLEPSPNAVELNLKPDLVGLARGETPELTIDSIQLTETFSLDLGDPTRLGTQGATVKATITVKTTRTRNKSTKRYSVRSESNIELDIKSRLE